METRIEITVIKENDTFNAESVRAIMNNAIEARDIKENKIVDEIIESLKPRIIEWAEKCSSEVIIRFTTSKDIVLDNPRVRRKIISLLEGLGFKASFCENCSAINIKW